MLEVIEERIEARRLQNESGSIHLKDRCRYILIRHNEVLIINSILIKIWQSCFTCSKTS